MSWEEGDQTVVDSLGRVVNTLRLWRMFCAGFRHSAGFHARVVLDGAACRLGGLGEVDDVLGVLGEDRVDSIVVCVLVSW